MAAPKQGKMPNKDQVIKTIEEKAPDGPQKEQVLEAIKTNQSKIPNQQQLMKTLNDQGLSMPEKEQLMKTVNNRGLDEEQKQKLMGQLRDKTQDAPEAQQLMQALAAQQQANGLLQKALSLKDMAMKCLNPMERQRLVQEAYDKELEANGHSKWAKRLTSGTWQGGMGGAGIGGGVGVGLGGVVGTTVGTLVGGVAAVPTTALGGLIGAGVGSITGPLVKLNQTKAKEVAEREKAKGKSDEEIAEAVTAEAGEEVVDEDSQGAVPAADYGPDKAAISQPEPGSAQRNLSRQHSTTGATTPTPNDQPRKKPRKIEVRSGAKSAAATG